MGTAKRGRKLCRWYLCCWVNIKSSIWDIPVFSVALKLCKHDRCFSEHHLCFWQREPAEEALKSNNMNLDQAMSKYLCNWLFFSLKWHRNHSWFCELDVITQINWIVFVFFFVNETYFSELLLANSLSLRRFFSVFSLSVKVLCWKRRWKWTSVEWEWPTIMEWSPNPLAAAHHQSPKSLPWTAPPSLTR